ncbi:MAG: hypothetical protein JJW00_07210, partial [Sulfurimonas sp.]|nr:hypothetical protein [Sulfurimonas sp.]
ASGISKLTVDLDALDKEFASGAVTMDQYTAKLRKLGIEANKVGKIKAFGLGTVSTKGFSDAFKGMEKMNTLFSSNMTQMNKIGISSMDQVFKLISDPKAWDDFSANTLKGYSKFDSETQKISNKFSRLVDEISDPSRKAIVGISQSAMERDFVKQTKNMSALKESWKGLTDGIGLNTKKAKSFWSTFKGLLIPASQGISKFGSDFDKAIAKREALTKLSSGFRSLGAGIKSAAVAVKGFMSATIAMAAFSLILQKIFEAIEKVTRGTEYWAQQLGATNAEFNKSVASLMGNISGITRYVDKLTELRKAMDMHIKVQADMESEEFEQDLSHLRGLLEGTAEFENFEFHVKHGDVVDATIAWRELSKVIKNLSEETSVKAIGRFVELGSRYKEAAEIYKETIETSLEGSKLKSAWGFVTGKEADTSLKFGAADWSQPDKIKFKRQGQEAAKLILDSAKVVMQQGATTFDFVWDDEVLASFDKRLGNTAESAVLFGDSLKTTDLKFSSFIKNIKRNVKTAELFNVFKEVGKDLDRVFQVEGAEEFSTFMKMFPNLAAESNDEVRGLAESWANMGKDERAVVLINAARKDLKLFHQSMKAISSDANMLQAADSTKKFVNVATTDIAMLNTSISQMGGILASQFEENWDRTWGQWVENGSTAAVDVEKSLSGIFDFGSKSVLGKLERDISKTTKPLVESFTKAYTKVGSAWAKESSKMIKDNKLPEAFAEWGNELKIALSGPWAKAKHAQNEWRNGMNNAVNAATMRFKLLQDSMSKMGGLVAEEWRRAQSSVVNTSFGSEQEGKDSVEDFSKGMEKSLKESIKAGHKGVQELAKAMSTDVAGAIDLTTKRMERLTSVIAQAKTFSIEVGDTMSKWSQGISLTNKVLASTLDYLKKFTKSTEITELTRSIKLSLIKGKITRAGEAYTRTKEIAITPEARLAAAKEYQTTMESIQQELEVFAMDGFKKTLTEKQKAEEKVITDNAKLAIDEEKEKFRVTKERLNLLTRAGKRGWKGEQGQDDASQKSRTEDEAKWSAEKEREQKRHDAEVTSINKEKEEALKQLREQGGKTAEAAVNLVSKIYDKDTGQVTITNISELASEVGGLGDPKLVEDFDSILNLTETLNNEMATAQKDAKEIASRAEKDYQEVKTSLKSLITLQEKLTKYSETMAKQSKVIADLLKREGLAQAIQALGAMGFNVKLDEEGAFKDSKTLEMFNTLIGEASEGLVDMADRLQKQVQRRPVKGFGPTEIKHVDVVSEIAKQLYNFGESFPQVSSQVDELSTQFLIQLERMKASGKTQVEIDSRLNTVLTGITGITDDAKNLDPTALGSFLKDITDMIKITSSDLKSVDISKFQVGATSNLLQQQIKPTESESVLRRVQENQGKIDSFVSELPQWSEVAEKVEEVAISAFEDVGKAGQYLFSKFNERDKKSYLEKDKFRLKGDVLQRKTP